MLSNDSAIVSVLNISCAPLPSCVLWIKISLSMLNKAPPLAVGICICQNTWTVNTSGWTIFNLTPFTKLVKSNFVKLVQFSQGHPQLELFTNSVGIVQNLSRVWQVLVSGRNVCVACCKQLHLFLVLGRKYIMNLNLLQGLCSGIYVPYSVYSAEGAGQARSLPWLYVIRRTSRRNNLSNTSLVCNGW